MTHVTKTYGSPGTGKTTSLLNNVVGELRNGISIREIAFMGYTRAACSEAQDRARKIVDFGDQRFWFMTIHATCLKLLRQRGIFNKVISWKDRKTFCDEYGLRLPEYQSNVILGDSLSPGTAFFSIQGWLQNTLRSPEDWKECSFAEDLDTPEYVHLFESWKKFKAENEKMDFNDMLVWTYKLRPKLPTRILMIDEFQDLSPLQREIILQFMDKKERVYVAGDDDQALYRFQGAEPEGMLDFDSDNTVVLDQSYRCPEQIFDLASTFIAKNQIRQPKEINPRPGADGDVLWMRSPTISSLMRRRRGKTFVLLRTNYYVSKIAWEMISSGIPFRYLDGKKDRILGWTRKKRSLHRKILSLPYGARRNYLDKVTWNGSISKGMASFLRGYIFRQTCIVPEDLDLFIGTIHSAKGREADTVILFDNVTPRITRSMYEERGLEDERRVWYVGMTRAKYLLIIVQGPFGTSIDLPARLGL